MAQPHSSFQQLRLEGLKRNFGNYNALKGLDLTIQRGEFIALLGPSGCGKTTALNCLAGLLSVTGGRIMLDDRRIDTLRPEERGFGMVFQNYALFPHMNVRRNVGFGLRMRGIARAEIDRRVQEALRLVRLEAQADKLPGQMSGGQQQRVAIARAIVIEPPLVLMDEPLSNLDAKLRLEMRAEIRRIHQQLGSTTIYVTHDQEEALSLADRIVVLREGEIRQVGTPHELYASPTSVDVADFMGYRNRITGKVVTAGNGQTTIEVDGGTLVGTGLAKGKDAIAAIRPDHLTPSDSPSAIPAKVVAIEYRGNAFHGLASTPSGLELHFSTPRSVKPGDIIRLGADPAHVLVFEASAS